MSGLNENNVMLNARHNCKAEVHQILVEEVLNEPSGAQTAQK